MFGKKRVAAFVFIGLITLALLVFLTELFQPKYMHGIVEGALTNEYYEEKLPHDVIFVGDCEVYENFSPMTLWEKYGITSYIRGNAQQLVWQSYYMLKDALRYEKPRAVVFNVLSMKYNEPQKESYNRMTIDGMRWSTDKVGCILSSATEEEHFTEYLFPIFRYHSRWSELEADDFRYLFKKDKISHNGYYMRTDVKPAGEFPVDKKLPDYTFGENACNYLNKIRDLCRKNDIELILIKAPSLYPSWYNEWDEQICEYAEENGLRYINLLEATDDIGLDYATDTYDGGLHLNVYGAEKLSDYFGRILSKDYQIPDHRGEKEYEDVYSEKLDFYYSMRNDPDAMQLYEKN